MIVPDHSNVNGQSSRCRGCEPLRRATTSVRPVLLNCNGSPRSTSSSKSDPSSLGEPGRSPPSLSACRAFVPPARPTCSRRRVRCCRGAVVSSGQHWGTRRPAAGAIGCCEGRAVPTPANRWTCQVGSLADDYDADRAARAAAARRRHPALCGRCDFCTSRAHADSKRRRRRPPVAAGCDCHSAAGCPAGWARETFPGVLLRCGWIGDPWKQSAISHRVSADLEEPLILFIAFNYLTSVIFHSRRTKGSRTALPRIESWAIALKHLLG